MNHEPSSAILDYIPELDSDDPRIELAICEGEMEDYEVTDKINDLDLRLRNIILLLLRRKYTIFSF